MQTSINLQEPFYYSLIPLLIIIVLIIILIIYHRHFNKNAVKKEVEKKEVKVIPEKNKKNIPVIKTKYLKQLDEIEKKYNEQTIALRKAYQLISEAMRLFIFEVTDITTQNYSLAEIKKINLPVVYDLIKEYYEPEFASKSVGDFKSSIQKARSVIEKWN